MAGEHSILSPSSAHRRIRCVGSLAACKGMPNTETEYAAEGTAYHLLASTVLEALAADKDGQADDLGAGGMVCADYVGRIVNIFPKTVEFSHSKDLRANFSFVITEEDAAYAQVYVDAVRRLPGEQMYEVRLDTSLWLEIPGQGGTGDCVTLDYENATIHVDDLKFGRGEVVYAEGNEQLLEYAAAAYRMFDILTDWKHVRVGIHQPRIGHYDEHTYTVEELAAFIARAKPLEQLAYELWQSGDANKIATHLTPSTKGCRWCPLNGKCGAQRAQIAHEFASIAKTDEKTQAMFRMSDAELGAERDRVEFLANYVSAVKTEAHDRAIAGRDIPGWELVDGKAGARQWDEAGLNADLVQSALVDALGNEAWKPRELITPAVADKELNRKKHPAYERRSAAWSAMQKFITQSPPSKTLVRAGGASKPKRAEKVEFKPT